MFLTILLGLTAAVCWGAPDVWLAQATRNLGPFPVVFGAVLIGLVVIAPAALVVDLPGWSWRGVLLALLVGGLTVLGYQSGFTAFRHGAVSIVAPIIACEGAVAAAISIAGGEDIEGPILAFLVLAVVGVVLAAMGSGGGRAAVVPAVIAAVIWGAILALSAPVADDLGAYWAFMLIRSSALLVMIPFALRTGTAGAWLDDRWRVVAWGLGDAAAYLLFAYAADRGPVSVASVLVAQFATVAVIVGMVFGGERLLPRQLAGIALVIAAVTGMAAGGA